MARHAALEVATMQVHADMYRYISYFLQMYRVHPQVRVKVYGLGLTRTQRVRVDLFDPTVYIRRDTGAAGCTACPCHAGT